MKTMDFVGDIDTRGRIFHYGIKDTMAMDSLIDYERRNPTGNIQKLMDTRARMIDVEPLVRIILPHCAQARELVKERDAICARINKIKKTMTNQRTYTIGCKKIDPLLTRRTQILEQLTKKIDPLLTRRTQILEALTVIVCGKE